MTDHVETFDVLKVTLEQGQKVQILQNEMDKLRSDNVKLYEKIKFLQGYASKVGICTYYTGVAFTFCPFLS